MLITFEGTEGCGKSTLIQNLSVQLTQLKIPHIITREPGGSQVAEKIRAVILNENMDPITELFLYEAARAEHFVNTIAPALKAKKWVLCDRFTDSTLAYQGYARGLDLRTITLLNQIATHSKKPDLTFFLDLPVAEGLARAKDPNRFELEGLAFQTKVRRGFLATMKKEPKRFCAIKVKGKNAEAVCAETLAVIQKKLGHSGVSKRKPAPKRAKA